MNRYVDVEGLNFRKTPKIEANNRISVLHLGQQVEVVDETNLGWTEIKVTTTKKHQGFVKTVLTAQPDTGFLEQRSLRDAVLVEKEALVAEAVQQWLRFEFGQAQEHHHPYYKYVGEMWKSIGLKLDGRDRDIPWSAAAISFMVKSAAKKHSKYKNFKGAAAHSKYIHRSISQRNSSVKAAAFWGYQLHEKRPSIGDIVARWRKTTQTFESASVSDSFKSHTDIIVSVQPNYVVAIGGNVGQSVSITRYAKSSNGYLTGTGQVFALMVNRA